MRKYAFILFLFIVSVSYGQYKGTYFEARDSLLSPVLKVDTIILGTDTIIDIQTVIEIIDFDSLTTNKILADTAIFDLLEITNTITLNDSVIDTIYSGVIPNKEWVLENGGSSDSSWVKASADTVEATVKFKGGYIELDSIIFNDGSGSVTGVDTSNRLTGLYMIETDTAKLDVLIFDIDTLTGVTELNAAMQIIDSVAINNNGLFALPRYTSDPTAIREGQVYYNTTAHEPRYWNGSTWVPF